MSRQYPPGDFLAHAMNALPPPAAGLPPQTVEIDAGRWGVFRVTFVVKQNPRQGMRNHWFWIMESGERLELGK